MKLSEAQSADRISLVGVDRATEVGTGYVDPDGDRIAVPADALPDWDVTHAVASAGDAGYDADQWARRRAVCVAGPVGGKRVSYLSRQKHRVLEVTGDG